jgi:hypothetical protein
VLPAAVTAAAVTAAATALALASTLMLAIPLMRRGLSLMLWLGRWRVVFDLRRWAVVLHLRHGGVSLRRGVVMFDLRP